MNTSLILISFTSSSDDHIITHLSRRTATPHTLEEAIPLRQPVQAVIALGSRSHEAAKCIDLVLARVAACLVDLSNGNLHAGVVFGFDDAVGCAALTGDVEVNDVSFLVLHGCCEGGSCF